MKLKFKNEQKLFFFAAIIPIVIMAVAYAIIGIAPFGEKSILISDLSNEYVDYMVTYRSVLLGKHSIIYSWNFGMGGNIIGMIAFYLSSLLNIFLIVFPVDYIQEAILFITLLKIGLSGAFFAVFLNKTFSKYKTNIGILMFSTCYALMAYSITYTPHIMWLDGVLLLPLVLLCLDSFVKKNKKIGLISILFILFISNFYTAYMIGIFSVIYYWYNVISKKYSLSIKESFVKFVQFSGMAIISAAMSAILIIPTFMALVKEDSNEKLLAFGIRYKFGDVISKVFMGSFDTMKPGGTVNIYCGLIIVLYLILYFMNKEISKREKKAALFVGIIMYLSLRINTLYMIWHGLDNPDWFEGRFSFVISFFMIYLAYESYCRLDTDLLKKRILDIILLMIIAVLSFSIMKKYISNYSVILNVIFLLIYLCVLKININKKTINILLCLIVFLELGCNVLVNSHYLQKEERYENRKYYIDSRKRTENCIEYIGNHDNGVFRVEKDFMRRENEGLSAGYKGMSIFCSFYNKDVHKFLRSIGMPFSDKVGRYEDGTLVTNSILGIKYILSHNNMNYYQPIGKEDDIYIYRNNYALKLATLANKEVFNAEIDGDRYNPFEIQNNIVNGILGQELNLFNELKDFKVETENIKSLKNDEYTTRYEKADLNKEAIIKFLINIDDSKLAYLYLKNLEGNIDVLINNENISGFMGQTNKVLDLNKYNDKNVEVKLILNDNSLLLKNDIFYILDKEKFSDEFSRLQNGVEIDKFEDTKIKFTVNKENSNEELITSIPYDAGWKVFVNGKEEEVQKVFNSFIAINLPDGESKVELKYICPGLNIGISISIIGFILFGVVIYNEKKKKYN